MGLILILKYLSSFYCTIGRNLKDSKTYSICLIQIYLVNLIHYYNLVLWKHLFCWMLTVNANLHGTCIQIYSICEMFAKCIYTMYVHRDDLYKMWFTICYRCKLFYQRDGKWNEKGVGFLHLKKPDGKAQLVVRADTNLGILLTWILCGCTYVTLMYICNTDDLYI